MLDASSFLQSVSSSPLFNYAKLLDLAISHVDTEDVEDSAVLYDLVWRYRRDHSLACPDYECFFINRPQYGDDTEELLELIIKDVSGRVSHCVRVLAGATLLIYQGVRSDAQVEFRDSAIPLVVSSIIELGSDWRDAGYIFFCWIASRSMPFRSLGLDLIACSILSKDKSSELAAAARSQIEHEIKMYDERQEYAYHPPQIRYSQAVQSEWYCILDLGISMNPRSMPVYSDIKQLIAMR